MVEISSASQSSMVKECEATRVPGFIDRMVGLSFMLSAGSRYSVMTLACEKSVAKMSARRNCARSATPAFCALSCESFTMSGLYSMPWARAPNFFAAMITVRPSPEPRSKTTSLGPTWAMVSMRSTTSSGVGTQITSLPAWPTCGSNFWVWALAARGTRSASSASARGNGVIGVLRRTLRAAECSRNAYDVGKTAGLRVSEGGARTAMGSAPDLLQHFGGVVGEARTLAASERYVPGVAPVLHAIDDVGKPGGPLGKVGRIDLGDVAEAHHLGARAGPGDQGLHLLRRQVLRLVDDQPLVYEGSAAHEIERLHLDPGSHQVACGGAAPFAARLVGRVQYIQVVFQRAHPRRHLFLFRAGQEADVLAERHRDARHDDFGIALVVEHLREAGGERKERLAGARLTEERDEVDRRVHEQVEREVLLTVTRGDAPDRVLAVRVVAQRLDHGDAAGGFLHQRVERLLVALVVDELVHVQL